MWPTPRPPRHRVGGAAVLLAASVVPLPSAASSSETSAPARGGTPALTDDACICYVVSSTHVPGTQIDINPLDPDLGLPWDCPEPPLISDKDAKAPTVAEAVRAGLLPRFDKAGTP